MILDGDIIDYLENLTLEVKAQTDDEFTDFTFRLNLAGIDCKAVITLNHDDSSIDFLTGFRNPETLEGLADAMNEINMNSTMFRCFYDKGNDIVLLECYAFVNEENIFTVIDQSLVSLLEEDTELLENLVNTIYDPENEDEEDPDEEEADSMESEEDLMNLDGISDDESLDEEDDDTDDLETVDGIA